jgi:RNA-directed DNA polymerase
VADGGRESAGGRGAGTSGNGLASGTRPSPGRPCCGALEEGTRPDAQTVAARSPGLVKGVERAQRAPESQCNALAHLLEVAARTRASRRQRAEAAGGGEGVTKEQEGRHLAANLPDLQARVKAQRSRPQPLRRVHRPTAQGKTRPIGMAACEDTLVPDAVREVWAAMYAQDFLDGSYGLRPGRGAHGAGRPLKRLGNEGAGRGMVQADMVSVCDRVDRPKCKERRGMRGAAGSRLRLSGKGVPVGGLDGETVVEPAWGTAQGSGRSPVLGNVSRQYALDLWLEPGGKPRLQGKAPLMR